MHHAINNHRSVNNKGMFKRALRQALSSLQLVHSQSQMYYILGRGGCRFAAKQLLSSRAAAAHTAGTYAVAGSMPLVHPQQQASLQHQ
jgi:hypothetical protein